jgi:hypothetical protein
MGGKPPAFRVVNPFYAERRGSASPRVINNRSGKADPFRTSVGQADETETLRELNAPVPTVSQTVRSIRRDCAQRDEAARAADSL